MSNTKQSKTKTMSKEPNKITLKSAWAETKKAHNGFSMHLFYFAIFTIASIALAYLSPFSLIFTIPVVVIPSYFAFSSVNAVKGAKHGEDASFFILFKAYFSQFFFGGYRILIGVLKSLLTYTLSNTLIFSIYEFAYLSKNGEYNAIISKLQSTGDIATAYEEITTFLNNNVELQKAFILISTICVFLAVIAFLQHIAKHSPKMRRNLFSSRPFPIRQYAFVDRQVRRENRKFLFSTYIRTCWFIQLLIVLAGAGGIVLSYFFLKEFNISQSIAISLFMMFIVTLPFMNYISKVQDLVFIHLMNDYEETFARLTLEMISKYKDKIGIAEEDAKKIEELLSTDKLDKIDPPDDEENE